jgi:hypothetical protein
VAWEQFAAAALGSGGGLSLDTSSRSSVGPAQYGPVVVNVAGFGGTSKGSASAAGTFPAANGLDAGAGMNVGVPDSWILPAAVLGAAALIAVMLRRT